MCKNKSCICQKTSDELLEDFLDIWEGLFTPKEEARLEHESREG